MKNFLWIFAHYFRRTLLDPMWALPQIGLPLAFVIIIVMINTGHIEGEALARVATTNATVLMVLFQFIGGASVAAWIYEDFRSANRWRLHAAPVSRNTYILALAAASCLATIAQGAAVVGVSAAFFGARWDSVWVLAAAMLLSSLTAHMLAMLMLPLTKTKRAAEGLAMASAFLMYAFAGFGFPGINLDFLPVLPTPLGMGVNAIFYSGVILDDMGAAARNLLMMLAIAAALVAGIVALGRRRPF